MIKLSVIIVNYNVQYFLEQCILSVKASAHDMNIEIIVVDNNSKDDSCEMVQKKFPEVQLIANLKNVGFSMANNQGVEKANGEYILILNPDTVISEDTLEKIIDFAQQKDDLGALGVKFIDGTGNFLPECKRNIPTVRVASKKILGNSKDYYAGQIAENENMNIDILCGAFMLMKRKVFLEIEGFDESYFMYGEDVDLSYKLLKKGFHNYYYGSIAIIHYKGESTIKDAVNLKHFYGAMSLFYRKYFKFNRFYDLFSNLLFKVLVKYKSLTVKNIFEEDIMAHKVLYLGENHEIFDRINQIDQIIESTMSSKFEEVVFNFDMIIFDNNFISNKEIIEKLQSLKNQKILKRIIPRGANFYLGSDNSTSKGEVSKI